VEPRGRPDLLPPPLEEGVVHGRLDRLAVRDQQRHHQPGDVQAQLVRAPPGPGEEIVRPVMRPQPGKACPGQRPAHRALSRLCEEPAGQAAERAQRRSREQRREHGQQRHQRRRNLWCCVREQRRVSISSALHKHRRCLFLHSLTWRIPRSHGASRRPCFAVACRQARAVAGTGELRHWLRRLDGDGWPGSLAMASWRSRKPRWGRQRRG
jgi:hypothetical protein